LGGAIGSMGASAVSDQAHETIVQVQPHMAAVEKYRLDWISVEDGRLLPISWPIDKSYSRPSNPLIKKQVKYFLPSSGAAGELAVCLRNQAIESNL
jgi:hypothetical protein